MTTKSFAGAAVPTSISVGIDEIAMSITADAFAGWPTGVGGPFNVTLGRDTPTEEKVLALSITGVVMTISQRGYDSTVARAHGAGVTIEHGWFGVDAQDSNTHVNSTGSVHGLGPGDGSLVGTTKTQALSGKSMSGEANSFTNIPSSAIPSTTAEITGLHNKDIALQNDINQEVINRQTAVSGEATARANADTAHVTTGTTPNPHPQYQTQAQADLRYDAINAASSAVSAHVAAADPHTQYLTQAEGDALFLTPAEETALKRVTGSPGVRIASGIVNTTSQIVDVGANQDAGLFNYNGDVPFTVPPVIVVSIGSTSGGTTVFQARAVPTSATQFHLYLYNVGSIPSTAGHAIAVDWIAVGV